jgi:hypothetical protein
MMEINVKNILFARHVIIDKSTNTASIINMIENIASHSFPVMIQSFYIFILFERENSETVAEPPSMKIEIKNNDSLIFNQSNELNFGDKKRHRWIVGFNTFPVEHPGKLSANLLCDDEVIGSYEIEVYTNIQGEIRGE